ncbi:xanthine dehydrogenase molybdopterin binding subunit [Rhodoplanes roseus]|uniref:Xanthine dehydrogenase molybdopterin binding subunit n=1 Tax=Rhodoplanes roseus TaxID=29409 RepID=A0A327KYJ4_9BRAD|nr:xanthine dehydrogenase molybdopterin binding subunit [Rhodoplanes roseus]RAI43127.1 xanthine dehydrogenase molybdopterin binding subunit [Rhodoplanes roseus]
MSLREKPEVMLRHVRKPLLHDSAVKQVQGAAPYIDDLPEPAGTLHVAVGGAPKAHGTIATLDLDRVRQAPGVVAVITAADIPGKNCVSAHMEDEPILAADMVEFHGQPLFAVAATSRDAARRAVRLARIEIAAAPPAVTVDDGLETGARVLPDYAFLGGDPNAAIADAPLRASGTLRMGGQEHFYLEGQIALAIPGEDGAMLVHSSTQHPTEVQHIVARALGVPDAFVTCEIRRMGGGFGGKETQACQWAAIAAVAARVTGRPCKLRLDRDDDFMMTGKRHDFRADWSVGFDQEGVIAGLDVLLAARCGMSADCSAGVVDRAMFHADNTYHLPAFRIDTRRVKTNTVSNTAFRGFGGPQGILAAERVIDAIAWRLGRDPLDIRKANFYGPGRDRTPYGQVIEDHDVGRALIEQLERMSDYRARRAEIAVFNASSPILKRGLALTPLKFGISFTLASMNQAGALVHVYQDGSVHLNHGGTEMGQGLFQKVAQVAAEEFGIGLDRVRITPTSTEKVPNTSPTAASSGSDLNGMAVQAACRTIKTRMIAFAAEHWSVPEDQVVFENDHVLIGNQRIGFGELARAAHCGRVSLSSTGFYSTPKLHWDRERGTGHPFFYYAWGAACSEVLIDASTGENKVLRVDILHDVGRSLNPAIDIGQIEGGFVQGMGWLTTEELVYDAEGRLLTHAPSTYKIPVASDVPADFRVALYDGANREETIYRSKAVGEPPFNLAVSVFCALADAVEAACPGAGQKLDAPATPEAIVTAIGDFDVVAALAGALAPNS